MTTQSKDPQDNPESDVDKELKEWIKEQLHEAVRELGDKGIVESIIVEAKPAWVFPFQILLGKIREKDQSGGFAWFICGEEIPTDYMHSSKASSPREAVRHFSLKWQLKATRKNEAHLKSAGKWMPGTQLDHGNNQLVEQAEALYELVNEDSLWHQK
jgi:hypothetical protein